MDTNDTDTAATRPRETEDERRQRVAWEAEMIAEALADVAAGRVVSSTKVKAWIDSIGTDRALPVPYHYAAFISSKL